MYLTKSFSETILFLYRNFYHFDKIVQKKFFIRLLTAKMSTINLCKMQKAPERISAPGAVQSIFSLQ